MKKATVSKIAQSIAALVALCATSAHAALIAHYTFDVDNAGSTPDSVGSNTAALGNQVLINTTVSGRIGAGALEMTNVGTGKQPPFPRPPGRPIGSFRGLPQEGNSLQSTRYSQLRIDRSMYLSYINCQCQRPMYCVLN